MTTRERDNTTTQTGALGNETTAPEARVYYIASYYDYADRLVDTVDVGTNGGAVYTRPATIPADSATVLVTSQSYNAAGWVQDVTDPRGLDSRTYYDALGRKTQMIEDYTNGTPTAESNQTTNYTYDGDGHILTLQAVEPGGASQTTQWVYGVTTSAGSAINSKDLLATVEYPDPTTGAASASNEETFTADALGENLTYTDRAGNVHSYTYDILGRPSADAITTLASGFDNSVLCIQTAYNALSDPYLVTTYNAASGGSIVNQVENIYNGLDQLVQEYQSHSGAVVIGTTPSVQYAYTEMSGGQNNSRLTSMTYPNGRVLNYNYNTGVDSSISRLSSIADTSATLESELYLGLDTVVERDHPQPNVNQTYISQTGGTGDAGDQYTGLDRFGRVVEQNWVNAGTHTSTDDFQYGYDQDGNVQYQNNMVDSAFSALFHQSGAGNGYDGLNQMTGFARGTLSASQQGGQLDTVASPSSTESWSMAALGNFASVTLNGTQTNETTNQQNELTAVGSSSLTFDKNGNMLIDAQGHNYTYNAWNELVTVKNGGSVLDAYTVDGLGRRVTENAGTLADLYFSSQGQVLEEDVSGSMQDQYVWSPVYVNAMIERDTPTQRLYVQQDADWNVTALVNASGQVVERYAYDPYGAITFLTGGWGSEAQSAYGWHYLFQGGRLDTATGLYHFDHRDYSPTLQRWVEADPAGYSGSGANLYVTEGDSPVDGVDPTGLATAHTAAPPAGWTPTSDGGLPWYQRVDQWIGRHSGLEASTNWLASKSVDANGNFVGVGQPGAADGLIPFYGSGRAALDDAQNGHYWQMCLHAGLFATDVFMVRSIVGGVGKLAAGGVARRAAVHVGSSGIDVGEAQTVRVIQHGESVSDLIQEVAQRTYASGGNEHAIISLRNGQRAIVSGGPGGIDFSGMVQQLRRVILHTHPTPSPPSEADFNMLNQLGQRSSWIYGLFGGGLTKFTRP